MVKKNGSQNLTRSKCILCVIVIISIVLIGTMIFLKNNNLSGMVGGQQLCYQEDCIRTTKILIEDGEENTFVYAQNVIKNRGILFEFPQPGVYSLGLRNVDMPLDIVWLDEEYIIVYIKHDTQPCSADPCPAFSSPFTAKYILEINGGIVEGKKFKIGDILEIK